MIWVTRTFTFILVLAIIGIILPPEMVIADAIQWPDLKWMDGEIPGFLPIDEGISSFVDKYPDHLYVKFPYKDGEGSSLRYFYLSFTYKQPDLDKQFNTEINAIKKQIQLAETYKDRRLLTKDITANSGFYTAMVTINKNDSWTGGKVVIYRDSLISMSGGGLGWKSDTEFYEAFYPAEKYARDAIDRLEGGGLGVKMDQPYVSMVIYIAVGKVEIRRPGWHNWERAQPGTRVTSGTEVRTLEDGRCELDIQGDEHESVIRMETNAHLLVPTPQEKKDETVIELLLGRLWAGIKSWRAGDRLIVRTPNAIGGVKGTEFEVSYNGSQTTFNVIKGEVEVSDLNLKSTVLVTTGQTSTCLASGAPSKPVAYDAATLNKWWLTMSQESTQSSFGDKKKIKIGPLSCFIATAAYGSETVRELDTLRSFRDKVLTQSDAGRLFVDTYYQVSPPLAEFIAEHEEVRTFVREALLNPMVFILDKSQESWNN